MSKFKENDDVVILGESIGGFDFKGEKGKVIKTFPHEHYKIRVKDKEITYIGSKLELYDDKYIDELTTVYKEYIKNHVGNFMNHK